MALNLQQSSVRESLTIYNFCIHHIKSFKSHSTPKWYIGIDLFFFYFISEDISEMVTIRLVITPRLLSQFLSHSLISFFLLKLNWFLCSFTTRDWFTIDRTRNVIDRDMSWRGWNRNKINIRFLQIGIY